MGNPPPMEKLYASAQTKFCNVQHIFNMVVVWFQRRIYVVHGQVSINHGDDLLEIHAWVERSTMGCPACSKLTSQLSPLSDFTIGRNYYNPYDHMGRGELSTTGNCCNTLIISMLLKSL